MTPSLVWTGVSCGGKTRCDDSLERERGRSGGVRGARLPHLVGAILGPRSIVYGDLVHPGTVECQGQDARGETAAALRAHTKGLL